MRWEMISSNKGKELDATLYSQSPKNPTLLLLKSSVSLKTMTDEQAFISRTQIWLHVPKWPRHCFIFFICTQMQHWHGCSSVAVENCRLKSTRELNCSSNFSLLFQALNASRPIVELSSTVWMQPNLQSSHWQSVLVRLLSATSEAALPSCLALLPLSLWNWASVEMTVPSGDLRAHRWEEGTTWCECVCVCKRQRGERLLEEPKVTN